jgi:hypothetical protein
MRILKPSAINSWLSITAMLAAVALSPACSVSVKDHGDNGNGKVDINTPVGGIHVDENADARDTGLSVYPGARPKAKTSDGDKKSANVNLSAFGFGLKVVALEYESDDPPDKIIAFYQNQLKKYGSVLQCHGSRVQNNDFPFTGGKKSHIAGSELKCDDDNGSKTVELKAGTDDNQHIVSVDPEGKGSDFAIVWLRFREKEGDI